MKRSIRGNQAVTFGLLTGAVLLCAAPVAHALTAKAGAALQTVSDASLKEMKALFSPTAALTSGFGTAIGKTKTSLDLGNIVNGEQYYDEHSGVSGLKVSEPSAELLVGAASLAGELVVAHELSHLITHLTVPALFPAGKEVAHGIPQEVLADLLGAYCVVKTHKAANANIKADLMKHVADNLKDAKPSLHIFEAVSSSSAHPNASVRVGYLTAMLAALDATESLASFKTHVGALFAGKSGWLK